MLNDNKKEEVPLIGKRKSHNPTARALLMVFDYLLVMKQGTHRALINYHGLEVIRALELAGFVKVNLSKGAEYNFL
ncbi:hypothetical protein MHOCP_06670 [Moorella humiferrea]|uniref:hypothetical protein n=1 Tax=Neomoorella humiferrea TaxID=676965 RepID=UPI0030CCCB4A